MIAGAIGSPLGEPVDERALLGYAVGDCDPKAAGPSRQTAKAGPVFLVVSDGGEISPPGACDLGLYREDTRFLSTLELRVDGHAGTTLSATTHENALVICDFTQIGRREEAAFESHYLHLRRELLATVAGFTERMRLTNFVGEAIEVELALRFGADFADLFEMRGVRREARGTHFRTVAAEDGLLFRYRGRDGVLRSTLVELLGTGADVRGHEARVRVKLGRGETREVRYRVVALLGDERPEPSPGFERRLAEARDADLRWRAAATSVATSDGLFNVCVRQTETDLRSLVVEIDGDRIPAAGIPWYCAPFGRDAILAAMEVLPLDPEVAVSTLRFLARHQGKAIDDWRDEDPGKILHEMRFGEMARCGEVPHTPYYGTVDATPLFLVLVDKAMRWLGDEHLWKRLRPAVDAALDWIDRYGDRDGDGFIEYARRSPKGLVNQGWKDSWDGVSHPDGTPAEPPIALVEVQGYVYDAKRRLSDLFRRVGETDRAVRLDEEAKALRDRIERAFWLEDEGCYALALDGAKRPVRTLASNQGHLLFSRVPSAERARRVRDVLLSPAMWSGWGIRTVGRGQAVYNPLSYHNGTVWPHDNAFIAEGFCRYGMRGSAGRVLRALTDAARYFRLFRLPELFCGFDRHESDFPVHYPVACSPHAWASGAIVHVFFSMLGLRPRAFERKLHIEAPALPEHMQSARLENLRVGRSRATIRFVRHGRQTSAHVHGVEGEGLDVTVRFA